MKLHDNVLDSRDIIDRIEELSTDMFPKFNEQMFIDDKDEEESIDDTDDENFRAWLEKLAPTDDEAYELLALLKLQDECEDYSDWEHGETLIHANYRVDYVAELIKDSGDLPRDVPHYIAIDWQKTADNIEWDYARVELDGEEYLIRSC
jgi:hypothetical protein